MEYHSAVFIGRFQPLHSAHRQVLLKGLELAQNVIVIVGSSHAAPSFKNPFTFEERKAMILDSLALSASGRVHVFGVRDYFYNDNAWLADVQAKTESVIPHGASVALLGSYKDASSYYLRMFPQWTFETTKIAPTEGTAIRALLFEATYGTRPVMPDWEGCVPYPEEIPREIVQLVPDATLYALEKLVRTPRFGTLFQEYDFVKRYKEQWKAAPFPPTFVTTDTVVVCSGHVLVVERKDSPGKGLLALPGGFLGIHEHIQASALRELKEETGIRLPSVILESSIEAEHVFDHPHRSLRGRTITHGFYLKLKDGPLPEVKGGDDAARAFWMPLWDVIQNEDRFMDDHAHIISFFTNLGSR